MLLSACFVGVLLWLAAAQPPFIGIDAQGNLDLRAPGNKTVVINGADFGALLQQLDSLSTQVRALNARVVELPPAQGACVAVAHATTHGRGVQKVTLTSAGLGTVICTDLGYRVLYTFGAVPQIGPAPGINSVTQLRATFPRSDIQYDCNNNPGDDCGRATFTATIKTESSTFFLPGASVAFIEFTPPADGSMVWIKAANVFGAGTVRVTVGGVIMANLSANQVFDAAAPYKINDTVRVEEIDSGMVTIYYVLYK